MATKLTNWIIQKIDERGWSVRQLARRANLSHTTVNDVLNEKANPGTEFCIGIAQALREPPDHILRLAGILPSIAPNEESKQRLLDHWHYLTPEDRETVTALAIVLYEKRAEYKTPKD